MATIQRTMKQRGWAILAATVLVGGPAYAEVQSIQVQTAPIHSVPADDAPAAKVKPIALAAPEPIQLPALTAQNLTAQARVGATAETAPQPTTLNAQYAAAQNAAARRQPDATTTAVADARPAEPVVSLAHSLVDAANAFDVYMRRSAGLSAKFADGASVAKAVQVGAGYEPKQLEQGAIAYAALVALQDPMFVQTVHDLGLEARDRTELADALIARPRAVMEIPGSDGAAGTVSAVLGRMGYDAMTSGKALKQAAYDVQHEAWSKEAIANPNERLAKAKAQSAAKFSPTPADTAELIKTVVALRKAGPSGSTTAPTQTVINGLTLAALAVLGEAGDDKADRLTPLLSDAKAAECVKMAKLNLFQCLSVAGPHYEDVFCLGQHAVMDTAQCVVNAAGQSHPAAPAATLQLASAPIRQPQSVEIPFALDSAAGPERDDAFSRRSILAPPPAPPAAPAPAVAPSIALRDPNPLVRAEVEAQPQAERAPPARAQTYADDADDYAPPARTPARPARTQQQDRADQEQDYAAADDYTYARNPARAAPRRTQRNYYAPQDDGYASPAPQNPYADSYQRPAPAYPDYRSYYGGYYSPYGYYGR